ncbi:bifunctional 3,4-dihydroxy-2-butanone-4-phosphate synthase/GTP cyclohydrolase II [Lederbergia galactosidilytica]|uniref:Riboflavin biosynthesis protein RibBA n=1 Tax=Lederbergia galactosidilytica TaxID=217031 RepID=A0A177ZJI5_9BACI|nr:bifunctional 3,4-dihydroxy-2-butanone-4-phosphate synthase/GTP cyclohydrolase II [Lederbergia galactosidilytica]KRG16045.1 3,4-dihydroxy-2-butanone 4-phosphate synthase [Virgibacillus soli]MBP1915318.1 3,4-dihydroxy 2-butanone 4-phosphate synthase/GTP cyclohydrolase II [Lederbergia galactosidilytica]OAK68141.1 3,4-dihydroxy-2-butanone 4-phosphate synthase [Lederbergia galactosidilytica]
MFDSIEEAITDLRKGKVVIVVDDEDRENEGDFIGLADLVTPEMINVMAKFGRGLICVPITEEKAQQLELKLMTDQPTEGYGTAFTISIDHGSTHTGISAFERTKTIEAMVKTEAVAQDFVRPGHIFPLIAKNGGVLQRKGHTEAAVDLARLAGYSPAGVICEIMKDDGTMARTPDLQLMAKEMGLKLITIQDLVDYREQQESFIIRETEINLPTEYGHFRLVGYSEKLTGQEHLALIKGDLHTDEPILTRIHSECLTGDILGSYRCDCGPQLHAALKQIEKEGRGILLYMRQEGRGIGLINKLKAYNLQEQGFDTVEANEKLGFAADLRDYRLSAEILKDLNVQNVRLLTNNPKKIAGLEEHGLNISERVPIQMPLKEENRQYLQTKKEKLGHLFIF